MLLVNLLTAFLKRDLKMRAPSKIGLLFDLLAVVFSATTFFFVSRLVPETSTSLNPYGGNYFAFVLVGLAFAQYQGHALSGMIGALQTEKERGTLESLLVTPLSMTQFFLASTLWDFLYATMNVVVYACAGVFIFGMKLHSQGLFWACITFVLAYSSFIGMGVLSAAFFLRFRRGNPGVWLIGEVSELLGGVYFPIALLPVFLRGMPAWLPMTHALESFRLALLQGAGPSQLWPHWIALSGFAVFFLGTGAWAMTSALRYARRTGSLSHI